MGRGLSAQADWGRRDATRTATDPAATTLSGMTRLALLIVVAAAVASACAESGSSEYGLPAARWIAVDLAVEYSVDFEASVRLCALDDRGEVACSLDGEPVASGVPRDAWTDIAISDSLICALRADGQVFCYGQSDRADWRDGYNPAPRRVFTQIDGNWFAFCGLRDNGEVQCWDAPNSILPSLGPHTAVAVGDSTICATYASGRLTCRRGFRGFWGGGAPQSPHGGYADVDVASYGELQCVENGTDVCSEAPTCALSEAGEAFCWGRWTAEDWPPAPSGPFTAISVAPTHACALRPDGAVACWGANALAAPGDARFTALASVEGRTCGITLEAEIRCWG